MERKANTQVTDKVCLIDRLAVGSMGEVWLAYHETLRTEVAVKFISDRVAETQADAAERFSLEAAASAKIRSPHVVQTFDHGLMEDGTPYIVMELLEGESLGARLRACQTLELDEVAVIVRQVGKALDAGHALGIIHRDIKPDNIFLTHQDDEPFVKVLDFGTAKHTFMSSDARLTAPGMLVGTPGYMSRDQVLDPDSVSHHMDLWALAVVTYKCLTGSLPFAGNDVGEICAAIAEGRFTPLSQLRRDLPPACGQWFARAFHKDPSQRFASGAEMSKHFLLAVSGLLGLSAIPPSLRGSLPPSLRGAQPPSQPGAQPPPLPGSPLSQPPPLPGSPLSQPGSQSPSQPGSQSPPAAAGRRPRRLLIGAAAVVLAAAGALILERPWVTTPPAGTAASSGSSAAAIRSAGSVTTASATAASPPVLAPQALRDELAAQRVAVPAGALWMGCDDEDDADCEDDEKPGRRVSVAAFRIDRTEVTVGAYRHCANEGPCTTEQLGRSRAPDGSGLISSVWCNWDQPARDHHPLNCVSHQQAATYCGWVGARLPSEAEWERAARGDDKRRFPWGGKFATCTFAVMRQGSKGCRADGTAVVGSKPAGKSPFDVLNLAGNVREWTADWYDASYYRSGPAKDPPGPDSGRLRAIRGGSWQDTVGRELRTSARQGADPLSRSFLVGFRCAQ